MSADQEFIALDMRLFRLMREAGGKQEEVATLRARWEELREQVAIEALHDWLDELPPVDP